MVFCAGAQVDADQPLMAAGLDSLGSMEFVSVLSQRLRLPLPATLPFNYPTAAAVAAHLSDLLAAATGSYASALGKCAAVVPPLLPAAAAERRDTDTDGLRHSRPIGIMAAVSQPLYCSDTTAATHAAATEDAVYTVPYQRWDVDAATAATTTALGGTTAGSRFGAFMRGVELFDADAFGMLAPEATAADPQHRLLLQLTGKLTTPAHAARPIEGISASRQ